MKRLLSLFRRLIWGVQSENVSLVDDGTLSALLEKSGQLEMIYAGQARCAVCGKLISMETIGAVVANADRWDLICDDQICIKHNHAPIFPTDS